MESGECRAMGGIWGDPVSTGWGVLSPGKPERCYCRRGRPAARWPGPDVPAAATLGGVLHLM